MNGRFAVYKKSRPEIPDPAKVLVGDAEAPDWDGIEPDDIIDGYDTLSDLLDESDEYAWRELDVESAPIRTVCVKCDSVIQTHDETLVQEKRDVHHISKGC